MTVSQSSHMPAHRVLVLPGWQGSGPDVQCQLQTVYFDFDLLIDGSIDY